MDSFAEAVSRLIDAVAAGEDLSAAEFAHLTSPLQARLRRRFPTISEDVRVDIVSEALFRFLRAANSGQMDARRNPAGYLVSITDHLAVDSLRSRSFLLEDPEQTEVCVSDDEIAALLDTQASSEAVVNALKRAVAAGDHDCVRIVTEWLVIAEESGAAPSLRQAANRIGTSYISVFRALERFKRYLAVEVDGQASA